MSQAFGDRLPGIVVLAVVASLSVLCSDAVVAKEKVKKPKLKLSILPRMAMAPVDALLVARLEGGGEVEELYCPEVEIEWGDGSSSVQEPECSPFEPGVTKIERRYSASHRFGRSGSYDVWFRLRRDDRTVLDERIQLRVSPALGEMD